jgi:hypothetical protein
MWYEIEIWYGIEIPRTNEFMASVIVFCDFVLLLRLQFPLDLSFTDEKESPSFISFQICTFVLSQQATISHSKLPFLTASYHFLTDQTLKSPFSFNSFLFAFSSQIAQNKARPKRNSDKVSFFHIKLY